MKSVVRFCLEKKKDRGKYGQLQNFKLIEICIKYSIDMMKISSAGYPNTHEIIDITREPIKLPFGIGMLLMWEQRLKFSP